MSDWKRDDSGGRYCEGCRRFHGSLYVCECYTAEQQAEVRALGEKFRANLRDPKWLQEQRDNGIPDSVLAIYRMFAGVE